MTVIAVLVALYFAVRWTARRHFGAGERCDVHLRPRSRALDIGLSHGGRRRRGVLRGARAIGADPRADRELSDQEMAATAALVAAAFYLLLSGAEVATQRSFFMTAVVLIAVMVDRRAVTFRTLAVAAMIVLAIAPEALVHLSFQSLRA